MHVVFLSFVLLLLEQTLCSKVCINHFDNCEACLQTAGCGWCSEGICTSNTSKFCETPLLYDRSICVKTQKQRDVLQASDPCSALSGVGDYYCQACSAATTFQCIPCSTPQAPGSYFCTSTASLCTSSFGLPYGSSIQFEQVLGCPANNASIPTTADPVIITVTITLSSGSPQIAATEIAAAMNEYFGFSPPLSAENVVVISVQTSNGTKRSSEAYKVEFYFTDAEGLTSAQLAQYFISAIESAPQSPLFGNLQPSAASISSNSGRGSAGISKGALAGIIIGSVVGGMALIALIIFLFWRKSSASPLAFATPSASYRP